uniref:UDP-galactose transporter n=1 Tax=Panagrolaimus sp. PS1159 TaxID=55785 RepID=A0AC35FYT7_9BILA
MNRSNNQDVKLLDETLTKDIDAQRKVGWVKWLKYVSLVVLVVQNAGQVLIMRYASTRPQQKFLNTVAVFFNEICKLIFSLILFSATSKSLNSVLRSLKYHFCTNFLDTLKVGVPALIYTIQNVLLYIAVENLEAATYMWLSLVVLIAGVALVQINAGKVQSSTVSPLDVFNETITTSPPEIKDVMRHGNPLYGLLAVLAACVLSGFAGIYFEKILKGSNVSIWMRNIQLAVLSIPCGIIIIAIKDHDAVLKNGLMQGFDWVVWIVVFVQAVGGLIVAVVIKYADNILKAFATSVAIIIGMVAQIIIFNIWPKLLFLFGAILVIAAVFIYGMFPYKTTRPESPTALIVKEVAENNEEHQDANNEVEISNRTSKA